MTPFAEFIADEIATPKRHRRFTDNADMLGRFRDVHFFDVQAVWKLAVDSTAKPPPDRLVFLPAERTWLEFQTDLRQSEDLSIMGPGLVGILLERMDRGDIRMHVAALILYEKEGDARGEVFGAASLARQVCASNLSFGIQEFPLGAPPIQVMHGQTHQDFLRSIAWLLALINVPRGVIRQRHGTDPRAAGRIQRAGLSGHFPLRGWTEIKLEVPPKPRVEEPQGPHAGGKRCLHFVREHLRIVGDGVTVVREHWRGDASLGIRQSRYVVGE